jgi:hypothetical protein
VAPEIWIGRLTAGNLTFGIDEIALVNNYFAKNRAYRTGELALPARALVYVDDDWAYGADSQGQVMSLLFPDTTVISDRDITRAKDYGGHLADYYAWIHLLAHSTAHAHYFTYHEDGVSRSSLIYNDSIYEIDPHAFFYNLFACGAGRFIEPDYIAGWYVFADSYGLVALGSTTSGGVEVAVPPDTVTGDTDRATVVVASQGDSNRQHTIILATTAERPKPPCYDLFLPLVTR